MTDDEIIEFFFMYGCKSPDGRTLPLRNCDKINYLYNKELKETDCCDFMQERVYEVYKHRLKKFLELEKIKEDHNTH